MKKNTENLNNGKTNGNIKGVFTSSSKNNVIPLNQTSTITANKSQSTNNVPTISETDVKLSKKFVDENHL